MGRGSVSLRLYPCGDTSATGTIEELRGQAALAAAHGWDGVMTSEHHGGFAGYLPNPLQLAGWLLDAMPTGWAAACPLLLLLRPPALVAEEAAWLAARFPGRVGLGVAAGALAQDFAIMGTTRDDLGPRFTAAIEALAPMLRGDAPHPLALDAAIAACATHPIPLVSAAMSPAAVRRAARVGTGILFDSLTSAERCRTLADAYRTAGGAGPVVLIRRAWIGPPPRAALDAQVDVYRTYASAAAQQGWDEDQLVSVDDPLAVAERLTSVAAAVGADALNLRLTVPDVAPEAVREQIVRLGDEVVPRVRAALTSAAV
jgi:alkanesulfonate monooxygenase SsuD/methylene tetrahydromethanopterin reductase-like flavin-dependent oxidoreductase (luciferase family)